MGLADAFNAEDRVPLKVSTLSDILRAEATSHAANKFMINGLKAGLPAEHILIMIGENEEAVNE